MLKNILRNGFLISLVTCLSALCYVLCFISRCDGSDAISSTCTMSQRSRWFEHKMSRSPRHRSTDKRIEALYQTQYPNQTLAVDFSEDLKELASLFGQLQVDARELPLIPPAIDETSYYLDKLANRHHLHSETSKINTIFRFADMVAIEIRRAFNIGAPQHLMKIAKIGRNIAGLEMFFRDEIEHTFELLYFINGAQTKDSRIPGKTWQECCLRLLGKEAECDWVDEGWLYPVVLLRFLETIHEIDFLLEPVQDAEDELEMLYEYIWSGHNLERGEWVYRMHHDQNQSALDNLQYWFFPLHEVIKRTDGGRLKLLPKADLPNAVHSAALALRGFTCYSFLAVQRVRYDLFILKTSALKLKRDLERFGADYSRWEQWDTSLAYQDVLNVLAAAREHEPSESFAVLQMVADSWDGEPVLPAGSTEHETTL